MPLSPEQKHIYYFKYGLERVNQTGQFRGHSRGESSLVVLQGDSWRGEPWGVVVIDFSHAIDLLCKWAKHSPRLEDQTLAWTLNT